MALLRFLSLDIRAKAGFGLALTRLIPVCFLAPRTRSSRIRNKRLIVSRAAISSIGSCSLILCLSSVSFAQQNDLNGQDFDYGLRFVAPTSPVVVERDIAAQAALVHSLETEFGAYDLRLPEQLTSLGDSLKGSGEYAAAAQAFNRALHLTRINYGLYHQSQEAILDRLISVEIAQRNWAAVDDRYTYLELLYRRIYGTDDPRLEVGLRRVTDWHVTAFNVSIDSKSLEHLKQAHELFKLRLEIAQKTLDNDHPRIEVLTKNVSISERQLFLRSDIYRDYVIGKKGAARRSYIATID